MEVISMIADKVKALEQENTELKEQVKVLRDMCGGAVELPKNCEYCRNFQQYYIRTGNSYHPVYSGYCVAGNRTRKRNTDETCKSFAKKSYGKNFI